MLYLGMLTRYPAKDKVFFRWFLRTLKLIPFVHLFKNRSYSQKFEDILICSLVGEEVGSYIDVGSGLPCFGSNTYRLYKRGWRGILIDPVPRNIRLSKIFRPKDISLNFGVGKEEGILDFYHFDPYELSTFNVEIAYRRIESKVAKLKNVDSVKILPLSKILDGHILSSPLILSVDTEGFEMQVLLGFDWTNVKPAIICIEEFDNPINTDTDVKYFLLKHGYELTYYTGLSSIYTLSGFTASNESL